MKTEMKMLDNGNYESVVCYVQHECAISRIMRCVQYSYEMDKLKLKIDDGDPCEDGFSYEIDVNYCPACGFSVK